jgi:hypothetical protein
MLSELLVVHGALQSATESAISSLELSVGAGGRTLTSNVSIYSSSHDEDRDGLLDDWEDNAAVLANPWFVLDENEEWLAHRNDDHVVEFVRVTPIRNGSTEYVLFFYAVTWSRDYGKSNDAGRAESVFFSHNGDVERAIMAWEVLDSYTVHLRWVYTSAHEGDVVDHSGVWPACEGCALPANHGHYVGCTEGVDRMAAELLFLSGSLVLYASQGKHAIYPTNGVCEDVTLVKLSTCPPILGVPPSPDVSEDCGEGGIFRFDVFNAGEPWGRLIDALDDDDRLRGIFPGEAVWSDPDGRFCGGRTFDTNCPGLIGNKLIDVPGLLLSRMGYPLDAMPAPHSP